MDIARRILILVCLLWTAHLFGAEQPAKVELSATEFKMVVLSKIGHYIVWPKALQDIPITLGILGKDPFDGELEKLVKEQNDRLVMEPKAKGRKVVVRSVANPEEISQCQILFIPAESQGQWLELKKNLNTFGMLTGGESEDFLKMGGVFNFSLKDQKLIIQRTNATKAGLTVNSKLKSLSNVVIEK